jgi:NitT/TauT family transport system substrate-binding protein
MRMIRRVGGIAAALVLVVGGCSQLPGASPSAAITQLKVGLGYLPSVQFAPFYLAQQQGAYRDAGLDVTFENKIDPDLVTLVGQGALDIGVADGTSVIPAVSQRIPIRYVATIYGTYPSIVFAKSTSGIKTAADLEGRKIGIPGKYGSSWIMLQALLDSVGLTPDDVTVVEYPDFGQGVAVQQDAVDAATGFANNEPVQLELSGVDVTVLHVDDVVALPGPGLIASIATIDAKRAAVRGFIEATLAAMTQIAADPAKGLEAAITAVPELATQRDTQKAILAATIAAWSRPGGSATDYGSIDRTGWEASIAYLTRLGLVPNPVKVDDLVRTDLRS